MGLGLTISKMIVTQLNGSINMKSVYKQGTKFTFTIYVENMIINRDYDIDSFLIERSP